jgi:amidohydrolase
MHACGHDAHATMTLAAALALWKARDLLPQPTSWRAIFQPAEEIGEGAFEMIDAGALDQVGSIVALHVDPELAAGRVASRVGVLTACCRELRVRILGRGGHAARPHQSNDPIAVAVHFVNSVYQFVPRSIDSRDPVVVTFGCIQGGSSANIIPDRVELLGTLRTLSRSSAERVEEQIRRIASGVSSISGVEIAVDFEQGTDAVVNDPAVTATCEAAASEVVGLSQIQNIPLPSMGGEDFAGYLRLVPGCLLRLGAAMPGEETHFLHSTRFDIDEAALAIGARLLARAAVFLSSARNPAVDQISDPRRRLGERMSV